MLERSATELLGSLQSGELTAEDLAAACLRAVRGRDGELGAFLLCEEGSVLEQARAVDGRRKKGEPLGRLAGLPVAVKDNICVRGQRTTAASKILADFVPPYDATVIEKLRAADAVLFGKTNMDEFGMGSSTENSGFQVTRNPWDPARTPGGSSGGSAVAVATGMAPLALGTDTGGSIRQPSGFCGVVGLKPTYGRVSRYGLLAFGSSLDQIGPIARTVEDAALLLGVIAGHDRRDSTSVARPVAQYTEGLREPLRPLTVGVVREHLAEGLNEEVAAAVRAAAEVFRGLGATVKEVSLPSGRHAVAAYYIVAPAEASSNLARYDGAHYGHRAGEYADLIDMYTRSRGEGFGPEVKRRVMLGTFALSTGYKDAYYVKALQVRRLIKEDFDRALAGCDVLLGPTSPTPAFRLGEKVDDPVTMYLSDVFTIGCNLAGITGVSVPCGFTADGLPVGMQLLAGAFEEEKLLRAAAMYQAATDWHTRRPPVAVP